MTASLPDGMDDFLVEAGWGDASVDPLPGDASFRRYFRLTSGVRQALLMDAPPPAEDPRPFLRVGRWLTAQGLRAPQIYAARPESGLVLLEDFGLARMRDWLEHEPSSEPAVYRRAMDTLAALHQRPPGPFDPYSQEIYLREVGLFPEWFCPAAGITVDQTGFEAAWREVLHPVVKRQQPGVTVLRDYHSENIMLLDPGACDGGDQGLIDFQDALVGHPAYDIVSLLQDARRDVSPSLETAMLAHYCAAMGPEPTQFAADYAVLGAQRNTKIVGIFARLWQRDGKPRYLPMIPRVWAALERDLAHPALGPMARWFDANIPPEVRRRHGALLA